MPKTTRELARRRRLNADTESPPPPAPVDDFGKLDEPTLSNGLPERELREYLGEIAQAAKDHPESVAAATDFLRTLDLPEARRLLHVALSVGWTLEAVESVVDGLLLAGESLARAVNEQADLVRLGGQPS